MVEDETKCCWCWWAKENKEKRLICDNHSPDCYNKDVTDNANVCCRFININEL